MPISELPVDIEPEVLNKYTQDQLEEDARVLTAIHQTPVSTCCYSGTSLQALLQAIQEQQADMVIAGIHGGAANNRRWWGSTVTSWIGKISVPMIVVPENCSFSYITKITLATEVDLSNGDAGDSVRLLRELGERFHAQLDLVRVLDDSGDLHSSLSELPEQLMSYTRALSPRYACITGTDVAAALSRYIERNQVSLLAVMPHHHHFLYKIFKHSESKRLAAVSTVPLLVLPPDNPPHTIHR